jgi:AcrR family transcriptional regulator
MATRAEQREETRDRIIEAATDCFSGLGFRGASTREIARRAGTNQGLITYHFKSKDELWKAAADRVFQQLRKSLEASAAAVKSEDPKEQNRELIREFVRFSAAHPELFRMMVEEGKSDDPRMHWLVDTHLRHLYEGIPAFAAGPDGALGPHLYYLLAGAASVIFAVAPECRRLTGLDPTTDDAVETHANLVARLMVP